MRCFRGFLLVAMVLTAAGCGSETAAAPARGLETAAAADSSLPREEALHRFRRALDPVSGLAGPNSRDSLFAEFVRAVSAHDTASLNRMVIDEREFAYLFYPTTPQGLPPYDLSPQLMWDLLTRQSDRGLADALRRLGGRDLRLTGHDCGAEPAPEGENLIWGPCTVRVVVDGDTVAGRLTGPVLERAGRYKFVSYTNDLD